MITIFNYYLLFYFNYFLQKLGAMLEQVFVGLCGLIFGLCLSVLLLLPLRVLIRSWSRGKKVLIRIDQWCPIGISIRIINQSKGALSIRTIFPLEIIKLNLACLIDSFQAMLHRSEIQFMLNFWLLTRTFNSLSITLTLVFTILLVNRLLILWSFLPSLLIIGFILHILIIFIIIWAHFILWIGLIWLVIMALGGLDSLLIDTCLVLINCRVSTHISFYNQ